MGTRSFTRPRMSERARYELIVIYADIQVTLADDEISLLLQTNTLVVLILMCSYRWYA